MRLIAANSNQSACWALLKQNQQEIYMGEEAQNVARVWDLLEKLSISFFVTNAAEGMRGRPLAAIPKREDGGIYFLINKFQGAKDEELTKNPNVYLGFGDGSSKFVSVNGTATVSEDANLLERLWNPGAQAFWPDGPSTPGMASIIVIPEAAEYWDGPSTIVSTAKYLFALSTGTTPDMGPNAKVKI